MQVGNFELTFIGNNLVGMAAGQEFKDLAPALKQG